MQIENIPLSELSADPANVRSHPEASIAGITASLRRWGQQKPIIIDENNVVRAGNGVYEAAKSLGWESLQCVRTGLAGSELAAYALADNSTAALSHFSPDAADILSELKGELPDLDSAALGLDALLSAFVPPSDDDWAAAFEQSASGGGSGLDETVQVTFVLPPDYRDRLLAHLKTKNNNKNAAMRQWIDETSSSAP